MFSRQTNGGTGTAHNADAETSQFCIDAPRKCPVTVVNQKPIGMVECQKLAELLDGPLTYIYGGCANGAGRALGQQQCLNHIHRPIRESMAIR